MGTKLIIRGGRDYFYSYKVITHQNGDYSKTGIIHLVIKLYLTIERNLYKIFVLSGLSREES